MVFKPDFCSNLGVLSSCSEAHDMAISNADSVHREHRLLLKQELGRMVLFFTDQPTLLAPNLQVPTAFAPQEDLVHSFLFCFCFGFLPNVHKWVP
jgi:hypothetical protein